MGVIETLLLYLVVGGAVAAAMRVAESPAQHEKSIVGLAVRAVLWPFFAPGLLGQAVSSNPVRVGQTPRSLSSSSDGRLQEAQQRLVQALGSLDGLAEDVLQPQLTQIERMLGSLDTADQRLREMEDVLRSREFDQALVDAALHELQTQGYTDAEPRVRSLQARRRNIARLQAMRDRTQEELERALVKIEEMSSQVLLLRFAEQPEAQLVSLLTDVADSVEGLAAVVLEMSEV